MICFSVLPGSHFRFARSLDRGRNRLSYLSGGSPTVPILAKTDEVWKKRTHCWIKEHRTFPCSFSNILACMLPACRGHGIGVQVKGPKAKQNRKKNKNQNKTTPHQPLMLRLFPMLQILHWSETWSLPSASWWLLSSMPLRRHSFPCPVS